MSNIPQRSNLLSLTLCLVASSVFADTAERSAWDAPMVSYDRGVHAYFAGRYADADAFLLQAQANELNDPRPYYFRALTLLRLGRSAEAREEFGIAASFEAETPNRYAVGTALQRVQGADRLLLEKYRRMARASTQSLKSSQNAPAQRRTFDAGVLYQPVIVPLDEFLSEGDPRSLSPEEIASSAAAAEARAASAAPRPSTPAPVDPFRDDAPAVSPAIPAAPAAEVEGSAEIAQAAEEEMPAEDISTSAEDETPAEEPAADDSGDPFGDL
jgi:hypothetical protein